MSYGQAITDCISFVTISQKLQAGLGRVNIRVKLNPMDQVDMQTHCITGKVTAAPTFWTPLAGDNYLWASAATQFLTKRVHWTPSEQVLQLVRETTSEADRHKQTPLWIEFQTQSIDQANLFELFQPIYQVAMRDSVGIFPLPAAGWLADLSGDKL